MDKPCPHRPRCPGCRWWERPYAQQLAGKRARLAQALQPYPELADIEIAPCLGVSPHQGYRTRVKWAVQGRRIGLYGEEHQVIDTPCCLVVPPVALEVAALLRRRPPDGRGARLAGLDLRVTGDGRWLANLVIEAPVEPAAARLARTLAPLLVSGGGAGQRGVAYSWRAPGSPTLLGGAPTLLTGEPELVDRIGRVELPYPPGAFSQAHAGGATLLHDLLRQAIAELPADARHHLVDLYAGTGSLGLVLADLVDAVTLVEAYRPAAEAARRGAARLGQQVEVRGVAAERALDELTARPAAAGVIVLDPPRAGVAPAVLAAVCQARPHLVALVSCQATTLARDLALLATAGYRTDEVQPLDMMPGTPHVEALALLHPDQPTAAPVVALGHGWRLVARPPLLPCPASLPPGEPSADQLTPAGDLPRELSGLCLLADNAAAPPPEPAARQTVWMALVQGEWPAEEEIGRPGRAPGRDGAVRCRVTPVARAGSHTVVQLQVLAGELTATRRLLALRGHPVLGDDRFGDPAANRHLQARHGLTRPFLHGSCAYSPQGTLWSTALAPDLAATLASLRAREPDDEALLD